MSRIMKYGLFSTLSAYLLCSCTVSSSFPQRYYKENENTIIQLEKSYNSIYQSNPFAIAFSDPAFEQFRLEMKKDSLRYIYEFNIHDPSLRDTLSNYGYDTISVLQVIHDMKRIKCTWINILDHYVDGNKNLLVFMAIRPLELDLPFSPKKYFILTFYKQPQYYDEEGRLLDKRNLRRVRKVNNEIFWRINDRVCYSYSHHFR